jgi:hypothetical protein
MESGVTGIINKTALGYLFIIYSRNYFIRFVEDRKLQKEE